jgi:hypothetical protein
MELVAQTARTIHDSFAQGSDEAVYSENPRPGKHHHCINSPCSTQRPPHHFPTLQKQANPACYGPACFRVCLSLLPQVFKHDSSEFFRLPQSDGPLLKAQQLAAADFGADRTWFLVNGSTCGIQAAVMATCKPGDCLVLPRNCHQVPAIKALSLETQQDRFKPMDSRQFVHFGSLRTLSDSCGRSRPLDLGLPLVQALHHPPVTTDRLKLPTIPRRIPGSPVLLKELS